MPGSSLCSQIVVSSCTFHRCLRTLLIVVCCCAPLLATTTNWRGIIVAVKAGDNGQFHLVVRGTWGKVPLDGQKGVLVDPEKAHIFLDGQPSTAAAAFRPGHLVRCQDDLNYYECHSRDFSLPRRAGSLTANSGVYRLVLAGAVDIDYQSVSKGQPSTRHLTSNVAVHVACEDGQVAAIAIGGFENGNNTIPSLPCDATGLHISDGRLRGELAFELLSKRDNGANGGLFPAPGLGRLPCRISLDVGIGNAEVAGTYTGTCGDRKIGGTINGIGEELVVAPQHYTLWLVAVAPTGTDDVTAVRSSNPGISIRRTADGLESGPVYHLKGVSEGTARPVELQLDGQRVTGVVQFALHGAEESLRFDGMRIGDAIFGSCELNRADGEPGLGGRFRGGLAAVDAPSFCGFGEGGREKRHLEEHPEVPLSALHDSD